MTLPVFLLVRPQLGENIGAAARAMANFGLTELRIVAPRDGWPSESAEATATRSAAHILDAARVFETLEEAVGDLHHLYATTARDRFMNKPVLGPRAAVEQAVGRLAEGRRVGLLFGPERTGLENDDLAFAEALVTVPVDPAHASLNLAQCAVILAYEWRLAGHRPPAELPPDPPAAQSELLTLYMHLEEELERHDHFKSPDMRPHMVRSLRTLLARAGLSGQEVRTLHGVIRTLVTPPRE